jgi:hypothetical protein
MAWRELRRSELTAWNERLLAEPSASLRQYPLYNEGLRGSGALWVTLPGRYAGLIARGRRWTTGPRYLVHERPDGRATFVAMVSIGVPGFRVGCIVDGPVVFGGGAIDPAVLRDLVTWARRRQYVVLRLTHSNEEFLRHVESAAETERVDAVPFYPRASSELYVDLDADEETILSRFQAVARRNIRQARDAGYRISIDDDPAALDRAWSAFEGRSSEKGISYRNRDTYQRMMCDARPHQAAHLFTAWRDDTPIAAILNLRDRTTSHYFLGTINTGALGDSPSPAALLQWSAMQHARERGARYYNLGTRSGPVYTFKSKFRPDERVHPEPLALVVQPRLYRLVWRRLLPRLTRFVVPS